MGNFVICISPILLPLFAVALILSVLAIFFPKTGYILPLCSFGVLVGASIASVLLGASLFEIAMFVAIFLIINVFGLRRAMK